MSVTSGFFNSFNGDRRYNAEQMSAIFDGIINDGVFANIGTAFTVSAGTGVTVNVGVGRAWFNSTWIYNDAVLPVACDISEVVLDRIDAIVIEVDHSDSVRACAIQYIKGLPAEDPQRPTMIETDDVHQYPLAYIYRTAGSGTINQADITSMIGTSACPYITGILQVQNIDNIVAQWQDQWYQWFTSEVSNSEAEADAWIVEMKAEFDAWFESLSLILDDDVATNLAQLVVELQGKFDTLAKERAVYDDVLDSNGSPVLDSSDSIIEGKTTFADTGSASGTGNTSIVSAEIEELQNQINNKQDKIFGSPDQVMGFNESGNPAPVSIPIPKSVSVTLSAGGWSSAKQQTVSVPGVLADESKQLIMPTPTIASQAAYNEAGIQCTNQGTDTLTFTAEETPSATIILYIIIQEVRS